LGRFGLDEELHFHLLELAGAENEVFGGDFVAERFADLGDAKRKLDALRIDEVLEVRENSLRRLGTEKHGTGGVLDRAHEGLEHQVELTGRGEFAPALGTLTPLDLVGAKAQLAVLAVDQRVAKVL